MGNSCCSNEARKLDKTQRDKVDLQSYFAEEMQNEREELVFERFKQEMSARMNDLNKSNTRIDTQMSIDTVKMKEARRNSRFSENSQFFEEVIKKKRNNTLFAKKQQDGSVSTKTQTPSSQHRNRQNQDFEQAIVMNKPQSRTQQSIKAQEDFDQDLYGSVKQEKIIKTLMILQDECLRQNIQYQGVQRYDFSEIRRFLQQSNFNQQIAARKIIQDITWRKATLPVKSISLVNIIRSQSAVNFGHDRDECPTLILKPNKSIQNEQVTIGDVCTSKQVTPQCYQKYLINTFETLLPMKVRKEGLQNKLSILIDLDQGSFRLDIFEIIEELITNHYPERLNKIYVVNINLKNIKIQVQQKFQQKFYKKHLLLFDDNFKQNLIKFFDPQQLFVDYGGYMPSTENGFQIQKLNDVEDYNSKRFQKQEQVTLR
ncbi:UNKNOWN [Stylonychia lemnae]|uniref:CRAL-TRIO domain-containing protein n=1 Tax=Stylonychia lemnae TaxID=5949 RepID=A0A078ACF1_STYLE|nr:UNKNOWN [Stylonychia lemnae]|eukprot:CDW78503.1 UNKNOWN [Stylonychia lemnae]